MTFQSKPWPEDALSHIRALEARLATAERLIAWARDHLTDSDEVLAQLVKNLSRSPPDAQSGGSGATAMDTGIGVRLPTAAVKFGGGHVGSCREHGHAPVDCPNLEKHRGRAED